MNSNVNLKKISFPELTIAILIWMQFLLSITTSFTDTSFYNTCALLILAVAFVVYIITQKKINISKKTLIISMMLLIVFAYNAYLDMTNTKKMLVSLSCFIIGYIFVKLSGDYAKILLLKGFNLVLFITCLFGVVETVTGNFFDVYTVRVYSATYRVHSVFLHPIIFSQMMVIAFIINYYLTDNKSKKYIFNLMIIYCIALSLSRSAWILFVIIAVFMYLEYRIKNKGHLFLKKKIRRKNLAELGIVCIIIIAVLTQINLSGIFSNLIIRWQAIEGSVSMTYRWSTMTAILQQRLLDGNIIRWIIGAGYHGVQKAAAIVGIYFGTVGNNVIDNQWISILYDFGLIGLWVMISVFMKSIYCFFKTNDIYIKIAALICFSNLFMGFFCDTFEWSTAANITFLFIGMYVARNNKYVQKDKVQPFD